MREWLGGMFLIALVVGAAALVSTWEPAELVVVAAVLVFTVLCVVYGLIWLWMLGRVIVWCWKNGRLGDLFAPRGRFRREWDPLERPPGRS